MAIIKLFVFTLLALLTMSIYAQETSPLLVLDKNSSTAIPKKFRTSSDKINDAKINRLGFANLHIAASDQFQAASLPAILKRINAKHMTVIDLRNESHGFLNGNAISWYGLHNATNADKSPNDVKLIERSLLSGIKQSSQVTVYTIIAKNDGVIEEADPFLYPVKDVLTEDELVTQHQLKYQRFFVQDFHAPNSVEVMRFVNFVKTLPPQEWVYFHCRGGSGRSTTFMVMYDMLRNAKKVSFEDILARQEAIGGKNLLKLPPTTSYKYPLALARAKFIKEFYEYAKHSA